MRRKIVMNGSLIVGDVCIFFLVPFLAVWLRFEGHMNNPFTLALYRHALVILGIRLAAFYACGLYQRIWRYAGIREIGLIAIAVTLGSLVTYYYLAYNSVTLPRTVTAMTWAFDILFVGFSRFLVRIAYAVRARLAKNDARRKKILIYGAGDAGVMIAKELQHRQAEEKELVGFVDDDRYKWGNFILGLKVYGGGEAIASLIDEHNIDEIIIAMPSVEGTIVRSVMNECRKQGKCQVKTLPGLYELINGEVHIQHIRDVSVEDLLQRDPVKLNLKEMAAYLEGKRVLVTGAGGSIGSELCRQIAKTNPAALILLGKGENSIYEIHGELKNTYGALALKPVIADVRDQERIDGIFKRERPHVVFHAAAHKHVPLMEAQPVEAVRNNIFGTKIVAEAADRYGAERFVLISTDKAVNPTSVMGATKRLAELIIQNLSKSSDTKFTAVRFGNVLGSRGSVVPLFKKQIAAGGPITITHPDMVRYFMTIPEASQLVLQAGSISQGGEVFVLDMGEPVKIVDMARDLIELSGLVPEEDIQIKYSGLRPGEKLFEELLTAEEGTAATQHKKIYIANLKAINETKLYHGLGQLEREECAEKIILVLAHLLPSYVSTQLKSGKSSVETPSMQSLHIKGEELSMVSI